MANNGKIQSKRAGEKVMKKYTQFNLLFLIIFVVTGCMNEQPLENIEEIKIGVVETMGNKNKSYVHWYNEDLEEVGVQKLKYANLGNTFTKPVYDADEVYLIPEGLIGKKDTQKVISINQEEFAVTEYDIPNIALQDVALTDSYLFVNSNLNFQTHLSRLDRETGEFNEEILEEAYFESMLSVDDKLYLFGTMDRGSVENITENYLYVLDADFHLLETIDLTDVGNGAYKFLLDDRDLYISLATTKRDRPNSTLLKINVDTLEIEVIDLEINYPDSLVKYKDQLLIAHSDIVTGEGTIVTMLDLNTNEKEVVDLEMNIFFMDIYQNYLLVHDGENITLFDIDNDFELLQKTKVSQKDETYLSNIIVIE